MQERRESNHQVAALEPASDADLVRIDGGYTATDDIYTRGLWDSAGNDTLSAEFRRDVAVALRVMLS